MNATAEKPDTPLQPMALKDAPALIERVFPAQKISAEAQKERKANLGQTLTGLGSYWKGRKPLIMVRAIVLASLLPVTDDQQADLDIFEKLMAIDDASFGRREPKLSAGDVAARVKLESPWDYFDYTIKKGQSGEALSSEEIESLSFPIDPEQYPGMSIRWKRNIPDEDKWRLLVQAMQDLPYEEKVRLSKKPEECDPDVLYGPIWQEVNWHLTHLGIAASRHEDLVEQLGILRYGHRPRVGDTFCGGGSIPFEAARLGCDVYASDLNPVACMLTWGALNIIGAYPEKRAEIEKAQQQVADAVDAKITELGIEHNSRGDRAKAYLYCLETRCPETGWMVPLAPSWVISKTRNVYARLIPKPDEKRFEIEVITGASNKEMKAAEQGTVQNGQLVYELDGKVYRTPIRTLRGDYKDENGNTRNRLRQWEKHDFKPRPDDIFQERLYCIQWITKESLRKSRQETYFASVTKEDLERERVVERIVEENLADWQRDGLVPDMAIERGAKTDEPIRTRGWRYWYQLFNPRQLIFLAFTKKNIIVSELSKSVLLVYFAKLIDWSSRLCRYGTGAARESIAQTFYNQALDTFLNFGVRSFGFASTYLLEKSPSSPLNTKNTIRAESADRVIEKTEIYISDPPYADAINYHEITEFFIAWLRKNPPPPFDEWTWDSRRAFAIKGTGDDFRRSMVDAYKAMADQMPDNGLQCVMFTHQDTGV